MKIRFWYFSKSIVLQQLYKTEAILVQSKVSSQVIVALACNTLSEVPDGVDPRTSHVGCGGGPDVDFAWEQEKLRAPQPA